MPNQRLSTTCGMLKNDFDASRLSAAVGQGIAHELWAHGNEPARQTLATNMIEPADSLLRPPGRWCPLGRTPLTAPPAHTVTCRASFSTADRHLLKDSPRHRV